MVILLYSSLLKGEEAKITVTVREMLAEGPHSAAGTIPTAQVAVRLDANAVSPYFMNI